jgi:hypothetical protein
MRRSWRAVDWGTVIPLVNYWGNWALAYNVWWSPLYVGVPVGTPGSMQWYGWGQMSTGRVEWRFDPNVDRRPGNVGAYPSESSGGDVDPNPIAMESDGSGDGADLISPATIRALPSPNNPLFFEIKVSVGTGPRSAWNGRRSAAIRRATRSATPTTVGRCAPAARALPPRVRQAESPAGTWAPSTNTLAGAAAAGSSAATQTHSRSAPFLPSANYGNSSGMQPERYGRRYNCPRGTCEKGTPIYLIGATPICANVWLGPAGDTANANSCPAGQQRQEISEHARNRGLPPASRSARRSVRPS